MSKTTRNRGIVRLASLTLVAGTVLAGCSAVKEATSSAGEEAAEGDNVISVIATDDPAFSEPLETAKANLEKDGYTVKIDLVTDIVLPNTAVEQKQYDFNFFQNNAYRANFNEERGTDIQPAFYGFGAPSGIYSKKYKSISELPEGARIAIPQDPSNNGRTLKLLADAGLLTLKPNNVIRTSQRDILENPHNLQLIEVDQQTLLKTLPDVDAAFLFGRYALRAGLDPVKDALQFETEESVHLPYSLVVATTADRVNGKEAQDFRKAFQQDNVRQKYLDLFGDWVPLPWDRDPQADVAEWNS